MAPIGFVKLSGSGNDFICLDNRDGRFDDLLANGGVSHLARTLCRRGMGVGADGLIVAETTDLLPTVPLFARFFEPDGSEAELCGNGTACFVYWAMENLWYADEVRALTTAGVVHGRKVEGQYVRVCLPTPEDMRQGLELETAGRRWLADYILTGVPHLAVYVDDLANLEVDYWGCKLRHHAQFQPRGVNVNFVQVLAPGRLAVRTFEFGVENETLACGTGSASSAILAAMRFHWDDGILCGTTPVEVETAGGDTLRIWFTVQGEDRVSDVCLETIVRPVFHGVLAPELAAAALPPAALPK